MIGKFIDKHREDSLTASVFSHLLHLPTAMWWKILHTACSSKDLPRSVGELEGHEFWPRWAATGTSESTNYVEPDVFLRFATFDLIIEAKRQDEGGQSRAQWQQELVGYANEYGEEKQPVRLIALGGIRGLKQQKPLEHSWRSGEACSIAGSKERKRKITCPVDLCEWSRLLDQCQNAQRKQEKASTPDPQLAAHRRILGDLNDLFSWHGFATGRWFADFDFNKHRLGNSLTSHSRCFQRVSRQFSSS